MLKHEVVEHHESQIVSFSAQDFRGENSVVVREYYVGLDHSFEISWRLLVDRYLFDLDQEHIAPLFLGDLGRWLIFNFELFKQVLNCHLVLIQNHFHAHAFLECVSYDCAVPGKWNVIWHSNKLMEALVHICQRLINLLSYLHDFSDFVGCPARNIGARNVS